MEQLGQVTVDESGFGVEPVAVGVLGVNQNGSAVGTASTTSVLLGEVVSCSDWRAGGPVPCVAQLPRGTNWCW